MLFEINKNGLINITFDNISFFKIDLNKLSITDQKLILLLDDAITYGLTVIPQENRSSYFLDDKCIFVNTQSSSTSNLDNEIIIETYNKVNFCRINIPKLLTETRLDRKFDINGWRLVVCIFDFGFC